MIDQTEKTLAYFYLNRDLSVSVADLDSDLRMSRQEAVESLKYLQKADLIAMATCEYGRITGKGFEEGRQLSARKSSSESPGEGRGRK